MSDWQPCYDNAESQQHLRDLRLAHASIEDASPGRPIPVAELEELQSSVASWFGQWPDDQQLAFLSDLPVGEAAHLIERLDVELREHLLANLPSERREELERHWSPKGGLSVFA